MKVITFSNGSAALKASADEAFPETGVLVRDVINFVGSAYSFAAIPPAPTTPNFIEPVILTGGKLVVGDKTHLILSIALVPDGVIVSCLTTNLADIVLTDFIKKMNENLGYRFPLENSAARIYYSSVVVQFSTAIEDIVPAFSKIEELLANVSPVKRERYKPKTLAFGFGEPVTQMALAISSFENADFMLQRRVGEPYSSNRYFCTAPLRTDDQIRLLEQIERELPAN